MTRLSNVEPTRALWFKLMNWDGGRPPTLDYAICRAAFSTILRGLNLSFHVQFSLMRKLALVGARYVVMGCSDSEMILDNVKRERK